MTYLLLTFAFAFNLLCIGAKKKSKIVTVFSIIVLSVLFGGNNLNADYNAYLLNYRLVGTGNSYFDFDPFFNVLMKIGTNLNLEYNVFLTIICLFCYTLLFGLLYKRNGYKIHSVIMIYMIYSFFIDAVQVSNFVSNIMAIIFIYLMFEYRKNSSKRILILSVIFLTFAIGFHVSSIVLVPFYFFSKSKRTNILAIGAIIFACADTLLGHSIINVLFGIIPHFRAYASLTFYSLSINSGWGFLLYIGLILIMIGLIKCFGQEKKNEDILNLLQYILVLTPVMVISTISYTRFFRVLMIVYSGFYNKLSARYYKKDLKIYLAVVAIFVFLFFREVGMDNFYDIMNNNFYF